MVYIAPVHPSIRPSVLPCARARARSLARTSCTPYRTGKNPCRKCPCPLQLFFVLSSFEMEFPEKNLHFSFFRLTGGGWEYVFLVDLVFHPRHDVIHILGGGALLRGAVVNTKAESNTITKPKQEHEIEAFLFASGRGDGRLRRISCNLNGGGEGGVDVR